MTATVSRADLAQSLAGNLKSIRFFEDQAKQVSDNKDAIGVVAAQTDSIADATVITLSLNNAFNNERTLAVKDGLNLTDEGANKRIILGYDYPGPLIVPAGTKVTLDVSGETEVTLPATGTLATTDQVAAAVMFPGPYANDTGAAAGGVAIGATYRRADGVLAWRMV